jgi:hypothetical protein
LVCGAGPRAKIVALASKEMRARIDVALCEERKAVASLTAVRGCTGRQPGRLLATVDIPAECETFASASAVSAYTHNKQLDFR